MWAFEQNEKIEEKLRQQIEYRFRIRVETRLALEEQLNDQQFRKESEKREGQNYREKQLALWAERDKIDQLSDEKRRKKMAEYRRAIHEIIEQKKQQRVENLATELQVRNSEQEQEKRK